MDLIEHLKKDHAELRSLLDAADHALGEPQGVGLDDRLSADKNLLIEALKNFLLAFERHEEAESLVIKRLLRLENILSARPSASYPKISSKLHQSIEEGHASLKSITRLLSAITSYHDSDQIYAMRHVLASLRDELNRHLDYEEFQVFPKLKETLSPATLEKIIRWTKKNSPPPPARQGSK